MHYQHVSGSARLAGPLAEQEREPGGGKQATFLLWL